MKGFFDRFDKLNILIIGDVMIDAYMWGTADRISPEAPVPVVSVYKRENRLGGAANVALNVQALGATPIICSAIGMDLHGDTLLNIMKDTGLSTEGIIAVESRPTTVKTRVIAGDHHMLRIDSETDSLLPELVSNALVKRIESIIDSKDIDAIIFEDYDKGVISQTLIKKVVLMSRQKGILTVVDPKKRNFLYYEGVTLFKPNLKELREGINSSSTLSKDEDLEKAAQDLRTRLQADYVMTTLSERGIFIGSKDDSKFYPAHIRNIADVSGAGDTVIATTAVCMASGLDAFTTSAIANLAGGLVCEHVGVVSINRCRLLQEATKL